MVGAGGDAWAGREVPSVGMSCGEGPRGAPARPGQCTAHRTPRGAYGEIGHGQNLRLSPAATLRGLHCPPGLPGLGGGVGVLGPKALPQSGPGSCRRLQVFKNQPPAPPLRSSWHYFQVNGVGWGAGSPARGRPCARLALPRCYLALTTAPEMGLLPFHRLETESREA